MKILSFLNNRMEEVFLVILMALAVIIVTAQVVTRYVLKVPLPWSEEIARYLFLWLTWVGASYATKERKHINIDVVYQMLSPLGQKFCLIVSTLVWIVFLVIMSILDQILALMLILQVGIYNIMALHINYSRLLNNIL